MSKQSLTKALICDWSPSKTCVEMGPSKAEAMAHYHSDSKLYWNGTNIKPLPFRHPPPKKKRSKAGSVKNAGHKLLNNLLKSTQWAESTEGFSCQMKSHLDFFFLSFFSPLAPFPQTLFLLGAKSMVFQTQSKYSTEQVDDDGFFLAWEHFEGMFDDLFPAWFFFYSPHFWSGDQLAHTNSTF